MPRKVAVIGAGVSGLGAAWALHRHPDRFDFRLFEAQARIGGNAIAADMPQDDGVSRLPMAKPTRHKLILPVQREVQGALAERFLHYTAAPLRSK